MLYFHLFKNNTAGILTSLNVLTSSDLIRVKNFPHTKNENLAQDITASALLFNASTYALTETTQTSTSLTPTLTSLSPLVTFQDTTFSYSDSSLPSSISIEAPCSTSVSSFSYTLSPSLPSWLSYNPTGSTSTQTFNLTGTPLEISSLVLYSGSLSNDFPFNS